MQQHVFLEKQLSKHKLYNINVIHPSNHVITKLM